MGTEWKEPSERLDALAHAYGIVPSRTGYGGGTHPTDERTVIAALAAFGIDASSPEKVEVALAHRELDPWRRVLPPTLVLRQGHRRRVPVHVDHGDPVTLSLRLDPEAGGGTREIAQVDHYTEPREVDGRLVGRATFELPDDLPLGWHELEAHGPTARARATVVVVPTRLELPAHLTADRSSWGFMAQLYSVRSRASWGVGDFADLAELGWLAGRHGADFLLINPLHAAEPVAPLTPSPYLPTTRRFVNPLYVRVEEILETAYLSAADRSLVEWASEPAKALNEDAGPIDRDAAWTAKKSALETVFAAGRSAGRQAHFEAFRADQGQGLEDFALWCALEEHFAGRPWPVEARLGTPEVDALRDQLGERVDFYCWLQWVADQQLGAAQRAAREGGMKIGIMHDLAVGVHPEGADTWTLGDALADDIEVGAPPDVYNQQGQNWSQPPWRPDALDRSGYAPYRDMLRTVLRHAGALRVDHVIGLFRLWWIPAGFPATEGVYVYYDHEALVGILCLEAQRAGAVVIGEDLGTVEPWVRDYLAERGILGTSVLWFEKSADGGLLPPEHYRRLALATVTTHDLPPTAGYLAEEHVTLRASLGLLTEPEPLVRAEARREREGLLALLRERGLLGADPSERQVVEAMHRLVQRSPAALFGVALVDAVGERRAQNQPGTDTEYANWKVPLGDPSGRTILLDELFTHPRLRSLIAAIRG